MGRRHAVVLTAVGVEAVRTRRWLAQGPAERYSRPARADGAVGAHAATAIQEVSYDESLGTVSAG